MSQRAKTRARQERLKHRRSVRAANKSRYERQMSEGKNSKKAMRLRKNQANFTKHAHVQGSCGNIGCLRCSGAAVLGQYRLFQAVHGEVAAYHHTEKQHWARKRRHELTT